MFAVLKDLTAFNPLANRLAEVSRLAISPAFRQRATSDVTALTPAGLQIPGTRSGSFASGDRRQESVVVMGLIYLTFSLSLRIGIDQWLMICEKALRFRRSCVVLPGLGGVGGAHLEVLARQGIGRFVLTDPDRFELANINRQFGATVESRGRSKVEVSAERIRSIRPDAEIRALPEALHAGNMAAFLAGVDVVVDGLDAFTTETRRL